MSGTRQAPSTTDAPAVGSPGRRTVLALLCTGLFVVYLDTTVVSVALPAVRAALGGDIATLQWVVDAYVLTFACLLLSAGALGDLLGRRRVFLIGLIGFTIASAACALAPSAGLLLAARAVQGVFGAALVPVSLALVVGLYAQPAERARAIGVWAGTGGLALAAGPVVGGLLTENLGWASVFWLNVPIGVILTVALFRLLPPVAALPDSRVDVVGQLAFVIGIGALTWSLIESGSRGWGSIMVVSGLVIAAAALIFFVVWEGRCAAPMLPLDLIRQPVVAIACATNLFSISGFYIALFLLTLHLQVVQGLSAVETGVRFLAMTGAVMVASFVASAVAGRIGARIPAVAGSLSATAGLLGLLTVDASSGYLSYAWALVLLGAGISFVGAPATVALMSTVAPVRAGTASGASNTFRQLGAVLGISLAGSLVGTPPPTGSPADAFVAGMHTAFLVAIVGTVLGAVTSLGLPGRHRSPEPANAPSASAPATR